MHEPTPPPVPRPEPRSRAAAASGRLLHTLLFAGVARALRDLARPRPPRTPRPPRVAAPATVPAPLPRRATAWLLSAVAAAGALTAGGAAAAMGWVRTPYVTGQYAPVSQPVPFSHQLHATSFEIECRYCHSGVTRARTAGMPDSRSCIPCHSDAWLRSDWFAPVRRSVETGVPIAWRRVHDLPDHVFFNHAVHVRRGMACAACHGDVARMETVYQAAPLTMQWCVSCHQSPERWPEGGRAEEVARLTTCTACHR